MPFHVPDSCPYTIQEIVFNGATNARTYLIRERDHNGDFPHIYAKICSASQPTPPHKYAYRHYSYSRYLSGRGFEIKPEETPRVIVLSDTGSGIEAANTSSSWPPPAHDGTSRHQPEVWNINSFLEYTINPGGRIPYLVMTTHCHYDHIMGIGKLPSTSTTVLSSAHNKSFIFPYSHLQKNSLCGTMNLQAPRYDVGVWAEDMSRVVYTTISSGLSISTPYTILHTPGHTPDSIAWYDKDLRLLCVGDSLYVKETSTTRGAKWGSEPPMPTMFDLESDLKDWWDSVDKVLRFVRERNAEVEGERESVKNVNDAETVTDGPRSGIDKGEDVDEDEGFVLIDADDKENEKALDIKPAQTTSLPLRPARLRKEKATTPEATGSARQSTKQTGFDIPPPDQQGFTAWPTASTNSLLTPMITPSNFDRNALNSDPWMLVVDRNKPVGAQVQKHHHDTPPVLNPTTKNTGPKLRPRVLLCAAHTTLSIDAEGALVSMQGFMRRILNNEVPCKRVESGPRGEERWLWDFAIEDEERATRGQRCKLNGRQGYLIDGVFVSAGHLATHRGQVQYQGRGQGGEATASTYKYSVLSPLSIIEQGRRQILGIPCPLAPTTMSAQSPEAIIASDAASISNRPRNPNPRMKTGCLMCHMRKKQCDEGKPICAKCIQGGFPCKRLYYNDANQVQENQSQWSSSGGIV